MRRHHDQIYYSAMDLNGFLGCTHSTTLDLQDLDERLPRAQDDEQLKLVQELGLEHERQYLKRLQDQGLQVAIVGENGHLEDRVEETLAQMKRGPDIIFQAALRDGAWHGFADFLRKVPIPSNLGEFSYEAVDTKLSKHPEPRHVMQLCLYSDLLESVQGVCPRQMSLVLGDESVVSLRVEDFVHYYQAARKSFEAYVRSPVPEALPFPCAACEMCKWRELCAQRWIQEDHLSGVANIRKGQMVKLHQQGITTMQALAELPPEALIPKMAPQTLQTLRHQAALQVQKREDNENHVAVLPHAEGRGFARLPRQNEGDLFFDMEGDPLYPGGLEYLFGFYYRKNGEPLFRDFWAHNPAEERKAFQQVMDFLTAHLQRHPQAHVYHYNHYEETALKRLASQHATRENEVDDLLRQHKLVDLYKVVREGVRISEPKYSIKNLETFYMEKRQADVATAGDSIVVYEHWRKTQEQKLLKDIRDYNEDDCRSTMLLRDWLLTLRPDDVPWLDPYAAPPTEEQKQKQREAAQKVEAYLRQLTEGVEQELQFRELVGQLLEFHRREQKPQWWALFQRKESTEEELIEDRECLGGLRLDQSQPPVQIKNSLVTTYTFPEQETKLRKGQDCLRADTLERAGTIEELDITAGWIKLKRQRNQDPLPEILSLSPQGPRNERVLNDAIYRLADEIITGGGKYQAVRAFLQKLPPRIAGHSLGEPIITTTENALQQTIQAVANLQESYLFLQGPPGAGKTFTSSHVIVALLQRGQKVGISSNSHKAIHNLLRGVEKVAKEENLRFRGQKKSNENNKFDGEIVEDIFNNDKLDLSVDLIAGTAWLFARKDFVDHELDYLFVDEAGQVSLANLVAMGVSAKNLVLVGDQMQLGQPIQGVHPGDSGKSTLEYLLGGDATISADRGIFLGTTWRMHENVCRFISAAVYEGRLHPEEKNQHQRLLLTNPHPALRPNGISFLPVSHEGCSQKSEEEAQVIRAMIESLLEQSYQDRDGAVHPLGLGNIMVISPYNVQVNHLREVLPTGTQVGTIDLFQGQEAEVVLISMATSGAEDLPRNIEFLYSKNRLNVAISRARTLAVVVANPNLLTIPCRTLEELRLANLLCWVHDYAAASEDARAEWSQGEATPNLWRS